MTWQTPFLRSLIALLATTAIGFNSVRAQTTPAAPTSSSSSKPADEVVTLSPFEVVSDTRGYFSAT